jgi:integrase
MNHFRASITKRSISQKNREGKVKVYDRYILNYNDPVTGNRRIERYETRKAAEAAQNALIRQVDELVRRKGVEPPTIKDAVQYWLKSRGSSVSKFTLRSYTQITRDYIIGPVLLGSSANRREFGLTGKIPKGIDFVPMLGPDTLVSDITTGQIRTWSMTVQEITTPYVAKCAKKALSSILRLIEEDFNLRLSRMPTRTGPAYRRQQRQLLTEEQVQTVFAEAQRDKIWGVYYAFAFLTGTRPNEQLGLLWEDVDLAKARIRIHRSQQPDGSLKPFTKTNAGMREIPINSILLQMLTEWKERCPKLDGKLHRVFPAQGDRNGKGRRPGEHSDGGLSLNNYRMRVWYPMLKRLGLPQIPPYASRHMVISFLQAQGVDIGVVAKIAGHASPQITLQYYTHAVRERDGMMDHLNAAYGISHADTGTGVQE